jgi:ABC-type transporter Mla subunit MlaD
MAFIVILIAGAVGYTIYVLVYPSPRLVIAFDQIGNLTIEDPLCYNGVTIGTIRRMEGGGRNVFVTVEMRKPVDIYANYEIVTHDKGIMGDRLISISPGDGSHPRVSPGDTLHGTFQVGVSEVLGLAWKLEHTMRALVPYARKLLEGEADSPSFVESFSGVFLTIDSLSTRLASVAAEAGLSLDGQVSALNAALRDAGNVSRKITAAVPPAVSALDTTVMEIQEFAKELEDVIAATGPALEKVRALDTLLGENTAFNLGMKVRELRQLTDEVERGLLRLKLRISLWRQ